MMTKKIKSILFASIFVVSSTLLGDGVAIVNFSSCFTQSKKGQSEQASFEGLQKQMESHLETSEKELTDLATKLNDSEYRDGLSPEAEAEMVQKARSLEEEIMRYKNQYYQVFQQMRMRMLQQINTDIAAAAKVVAKAQKKDLILNEEMCFYHDPALDVTPLVIAEMDKAFQAETKKEGSKG